MSNASSSTSRADQYAAVKWGPGRAILVTLLTFIIAQLVAIGIVLSLVAIFGHGSQASEDWVNSTGGQFVFVVIAEALSLGFLWLFLRKRASLSSIGFPRKPRWSDGAWAVLGGLVYFAVFAVTVAIVTALFHIDAGQKQDIGFNEVVGHADQIFAFVSLVILPPIVEEILFRGVLFGGLRKKLSFFWAMLITSLLFAVPHLLEANTGVLWIGGIDTFILSIALCFLRERTGSLWASIGLHMLKNSVAFLYLYVFASHVLRP